MKVNVKFYAYLQVQIGGKSDIEIELEDGARISFLLTKICEDQKIKTVLLDENQELKSDITILKNGREIKFLDGLKTKLESGDKISVFPLVAGG